MKLSDKEIQTTYNLITEYHAKYLANKGVGLPSLKDKSGYTKGALVLVRLAFGYPKTKPVSKEELTLFMRQFYPKTNDVQQARHLGAQSGWYIISGTRGEISEYDVPKGSYMLVSLETPQPSFIKNRKTGLVSDDFEEIKKEYGYRCAVCGSKEGEPHFFRKSTRVQLQQGHMNPKKDLIAGNIIPQCQVCNRPDRNRWVYDNTGRVIAVADTPDGIRIVIKFLQNASMATLTEIYKVLKKIIGAK